jgi:hypothetical protein
MKPTVRHERVPTGVPDEPTSLVGAVTEVIAAGQQLVLDRIDLLQAEIKSEVSKAAVGVGLLAGAGVFSLLAWVVWTVALAVLLTRWLPLDASLAIAGGLNVAIAGGLGFVGYKKLSNPSAFDVLVPVEKLDQIEAKDPDVPPGFDPNPPMTEPTHA